MRTCHLGTMNPSGFRAEGGALPILVVVPHPVNSRRCTRCQTPDAQTVSAHTLYASHTRATWDAAASIPTQKTNPSSHITISGPATTNGPVPKTPRWKLLMQPSNSPRLRDQPLLATAIYYSVHYTILAVTAKTKTIGLASAAPELPRTRHAGWTRDCRSWWCVSLSLPSDPGLASRANKFTRKRCLLCAAWWQSGPLWWGLRFTVPAVAGSPPNLLAPRHLSQPEAHNPSNFPTWSRQGTWSLCPSGWLFHIILGEGWEGRGGEGGSSHDGKSSRSLAFPANIAFFVPHREAPFFFFWLWLWLWLSLEPRQPRRESFPEENGRQ